MRATYIVIHLYLRHILPNKRCYPSLKFNYLTTCNLDFLIVWYLLFKGFDGFDVRKIDDHEYTVEISCYFLTKWKDDRLILSDEILSKRRKHLNANHSMLTSEMAQNGELGILITWCHQWFFMLYRCYTHITQLFQPIIFYDNLMLKYHNEIFYRVIIWKWHNRIKCLV